jgi:hypothetical protein
LPDPERIRARALATNDPRWRDAMIALGRANATGCAEFHVTALGAAYCVDSAQHWTIIFSTRTALRR